MDKIWILWDLCAVILLICIVSQCATRGFVRVILSFVGYIAAAAIAGILSGPVARVLYDQVVRDILQYIIQSRLETAAADGAALPAELLLALPFVLRPMLQESGAALLQAYIGGDNATLTDLLLEALQEPVLSILGGVCFFVIFSLALVLVRRVSYLFGGLGRLPVIGTANTFLGGVIGMIEGVLILYLIGILLGIVITATGGELAWLNEAVMDDTFIVRFFYSLS